MLEGIIRQGYAECERIESSGQASGTEREIAMVKAKFEEAGALLANANSKAILGRPILDAPIAPLLTGYSQGETGHGNEYDGPFARPGEGNEQRSRDQEPVGAGGTRTGGSTTSRDMGGGGAL